MIKSFRDAETEDLFTREPTKRFKGKLAPRGVVMAKKKIHPVHPGEILKHEFLAPLGLSQYRLARETSVPPRRINEIVNGLRGISADTALRLARYFGTSERFWLNLQTHYDLEKEKDRLGDRLETEVRVHERTTPQVPD